MQAVHGENIELLDFESIPYEFEWSRRGPLKFKSLVY